MTERGNNIDYFSYQRNSSMYLLSISLIKSGVNSAVPNDKVKPAAYIENRQEGQPHEGAPCYPEGARSEGPTGAQCAARRLQEKSMDVLADGTLDN